MAAPSDDYDLEQLPPHQWPNVLRICYAGELTNKEAAERLGPDYEVLELRAALCVNKEDIDGDLLPATEVIFRARKER